MPGTRRLPSPLGRSLRKLAPLCLVILIAVATAEILLRVLGPFVPSRIGGYVYSAYGEFPGGIYFRDEESGVNFMHVNFDTTAYSHAYFWRHRTDEFGFRNPLGTEPREILLLGDSMVYGHGLEEEATLAQRLRSEHGWSVYNMARQGDCLYQQ